jgi:Flp pilus assembly protein TadG
MLKRLRRTEAGQALTEFALIATALFTLLFGVIQMGLLMAAQNGLVNGVRDATRRAATYRINEDSFSLSVFSTICSNVGTTLIDHLESDIPGYASSRLTRTIRYEWQQDPDAGDYFLVAHVTATYRNPLFFPLLGQFLDGPDGAIDNSLKLSASEQMRVENPVLDTPTAGDQSC